MGPGHELDPQLYMFLEPDQLAIDRARRVPRKQLSPPVAMALWTLRVFVIVVSVMVVYAFIEQLH